MISPQQIFLPNNTQNSRETDIYFTGGIRTHNPSKQVAADPHFRLLFHERPLLYPQRCCQGHGAADAASRGYQGHTTAHSGGFLPRCWVETDGGGNSSSERQSRLW